MTIKIEGLTVKQKTLMDIIWGMDSMDKVTSFIRSLPYADAVDAKGLVQIAVWETLEQEQGLEDYENAATAVIARCMQP